MNKNTFSPRGICAYQIEVETDDGIINNVKFRGGCSGNCQGISALVKGMKISEAIEKLSGIDCNGKGTSCPDQLAQALAKMS